MVGTRRGRKCPSHSFSRFRSLKISPQLVVLPAFQSLRWPIREPLRRLTGASARHSSSLRTCPSHSKWQDAFCLEYRRLFHASFTHRLALELTIYSSSCRNLSDRPQRPHLKVRMLALSLWLSGGEQHDRAAAGTNGVLAGVQWVKQKLLKCVMADDSVCPTTPELPI